MCQCFNRTAVGCNRFSRRMVWLLGQGMADCFAPAFGGPQIIRSFGHPLAFNAPSQRAAHHRARANPAQPCQLAVKFLLSRRWRPQQLGQSGGHRPKYCPLKLAGHTVYLFISRYMFTTAPLFGRFHSPLKEHAGSLHRQPLHHLQNVGDGRFDRSLLDPNEKGAHSRASSFTPQTLLFRPPGSNP